MVRKKAIIITIVSFLTTLFLFTSIGVSYAQQRITATLSAHPTSYSGKCPTTIEFRGKITVTRPGKVQYKFIRSDGAFAPVKTLTFKKAGSKEVSTTWTIGKSYSGWVAIHVLYPRDVKSNKARFKIQCAAQAQLPDLVVKTIKCGPGNKLFLTVANIGNSPLPPGWRAVADIFFDGVKMGHIDLGRPTSGDITPPGGIADYLVVFDIVKPITVKVFVDATNDIKESNERNNTKVAKVKPCEEVALPDLIIEDIDLDRNCQVVVKVKNNGPGIVPDTVWTHHHPKSAGVYLYINGKKWGGATIWKFDPGKSLQSPGGKATYTSKLKVSGTATITATIDHTKQVKETNEGNNKRAERLTCKVKPVITGYGEKCGMKGGRLTILGRNFGSRSGKGIALGGHGIHVDLIVVSWSDSKIIAKIPDDPRIQEGQWYYTGIEKADHSAWLSNINKNITICKALPDLHVVNFKYEGRNVTFDFPLQVVALGASKNLEISIQNWGTADAVGDFSVGIYLSTVRGGGCRPTSIKLWSTTVSTGLPEGENRRFSFTITIPTDLSTGNYWMYPMVDDTNRIAERYEEGNCSNSVPLRVVRR